LAPAQRTAPATCPCATATTTRLFVRTSTTIRGRPRAIREGMATARRPRATWEACPWGVSFFRPTPPEGRHPITTNSNTPLLHPTHPHQPEYLFDFRNANVSVNGQTFAQWYIEEYMFGPTGLGNPNISGYYVDDDWSGGRPSEMDGHAVEDMGLAPADVQAITGVFPRARARAHPHCARSLENRNAQPPRR
jgi:hypothetical protein